jgi:hypothetical protein
MLTTSNQDLLKYKAADFSIQQIDDVVFSIKIYNGLKATAIFYDKHIFVEINSKNSEVITRYCTPVPDDIKSIGQFLIYSLHSTILFKLSSYEFDLYIRNNGKLFKDYLFQSSPMRFSPEPASVKFYKGESIKDDHYPEIVFTCKKVVKNIFKYCVNTNPMPDYTVKPVAISYLVGDEFFEVCNLKTFSQCVHNTDKYERITSKNNLTYGINSQLTADFQLLKKNVKIERMLLLKKKNGCYCYVTKSFKKLTFIYLDGFSATYSKVEKTSYYDKISNYLYGKEIVPYYARDRMVVYTYFDGNVSTEKTKFTKEIAVTHQMSIMKQAMKNFKKATLKYPSDEILDRFAALGLSPDLPLSADELLVLDMYDI